MDEGVDGPIVHRLRELDHDVTYIAELAPGIDDERVLSKANDAGALLLTSDKDFGESNTVAPTVSGKARKER